MTPLACAATASVAMIVFGVVVCVVVIAFLRFIERMPDADEPGPPTGEEEGMGTEGRRFG